MFRPDFSRSFHRCLGRVMLLAIISLAMGLVSLPAYAVDPYIARYLQVSEPVALDFDDRGQRQVFSAEQFIEGKQLFEQHCASCHVGGTTLPDPSVPLSLAALAQATPPRVTIARLVEYMRQPMTYDGTDTTFLCREVPESWLSRSQSENLSAFILRAAQKAPGWGTTNFN